MFTTVWWCSLFNSFLNWWQLASGLFLLTSVTEENQEDIQISSIQFTMSHTSVLLDGLINYLCLTVCVLLDDENDACVAVEAVAKRPPPMFTAAMVGAWFWCRMKGWFSGAAAGAATTPQGCWIPGARDCWGTTELSCAPLSRNWSYTAVAVSASSCLAISLINRIIQIYVSSQPTNALPLETLPVAPTAMLHRPKAKISSKYLFVSHQERLVVVEAPFEYEFVARTEQTSVDLQLEANLFARRSDRHNTLSYEIFDFMYSAITNQYPITVKSICRPFCSTMETGTYCWVPTWQRKSIAKS